MRVVAVVVAAVVTAALLAHATDGRRIPTGRAAATTPAWAPTTVMRLNGGKPVITGQKSAFSYAYNPGFVPMPEPTPRPMPEDGACPNALGRPYGLLVRVQDVAANATTPYDVGPSSIVYTRALCVANTGASAAFEPITRDSVVLAPHARDSPLGAEDPRVAYDPATGVYFVLYTAVVPKPGGGASAHLALATTSAPPPWSSRDLSTLSYNLFPSESWSKSGALVVPDTSAGRHGYVLLFGDSTIVRGLQSASSASGSPPYVLNTTVWLPTRPAPAFDSALVEAGPPPLTLSDGTLLFIYNAAAAGFPSPKPGYNYRYAPGWAVLDPANPTRVLQRAEPDTPLMVPAEPWEKGVLPAEALTPNVVFIEGAAPAAAPDTFLVWYGAADSDVGMAQVSFAKDPATGRWSQTQPRPSHR